jgi:hypothetical protein
MAEVLAEYTCERDASQDPEWVKNKIKVADLRLRIWDHNLVTIEFVKDQCAIGTYRFCWNSFHAWATEGLDHWFMRYPKDHTDTYLKPSCVDEDVIIECYAAPPFRVVITMGVTCPEIVFNGLRGDYLRMTDTAAMKIQELPDQRGCFKKPDAKIDVAGGVRVLH